jgi:hypothetical protein
MMAPFLLSLHHPTIGARRLASPRRVRLRCRRACSAARVSMNLTRCRALGSAVAPSEEQGPVQLLGVAV